MGYSISCNFILHYSVPTTALIRGVSANDANENTRGYTAGPGAWVGVKPTGNSISFSNTKTVFG